MTKGSNTLTKKQSLSFALTSILLGAVGWVASFQLLTEYLKTLADPDYNPNCNISVLVTCGPNMGSWQGSVFGFSNTIVGVTAFAAPIIIGFAVLAGATFKAWFWKIYALGMLFGFSFISWLAYQSIYNLNTLCPWCMVVWIAMIPLWWWSVSKLLADGNIFDSPALIRVGEEIKQWSFVIVFLNYLLIAALAQFRLDWLFTEFGIGF